MIFGTQSALLCLAVLLVGVLHTMVPDHWAPIALLARRHGWSAMRTARTAAIAGTGHTVSTLLIAIIVWGAGAVFAQHFGRALSLTSSVALIGFGAWIALSSWREIKREAHGHGHSLLRHIHTHRHSDGLEHRHLHEHHEEEEGHEHRHGTSGRLALLLILGSSPMIEGIPAFFAAGRYGIGLLAVMAVLFAASTIATYVVLCVASAGGMQRLNLGRFEQYGEVLSGAFIAALGAVFLIWPLA